MERKQKRCTGTNCNNLFYPYRTIDKYCSAKCALPSYKPPKKTPLKKPTKPISKKPTIKRSEFEKEFTSIKRKLITQIIKQYGVVCCEKCFTQHSIAFSIHHIVFRSEKPNHKNLNHANNLIHLCYKCHDSFHSNKKSRNYLIKERNLISLFKDNIWGYPH